MAIVTLLTDAGTSDYYVAAIKARIIRMNPGVRIEDITHSISPSDIAHAAFVLRAVFRDFPKGTVHLVGVNAAGNKGDTLNSINTIDTTFPERDVFAPAAVKLASGMPITGLGKPMQTFKKMIDRQVKATKKQITGSIIRVDSMGNLITNIPKDVFEMLSKGKAYTITFGGEKFKRIHTQYHQAEQGECFLVFNSLGLLEIGIYKGNASELLGLEYDGVVNILFE